MSGSSSAELGDDLGAYQSLNNLAVGSFVFGALSVLSFAYWLFLWLLPPAAIVLGLIALKRITEAPEVWAGKKLAQTGIGLAVVCGGLALGHKAWTSWNNRMFGRAIAQRFVEKIEAGDIEAAFWLMFPKDARRELGSKPMEDLPEGIIERYANFRAEATGIADGAASGQMKFEFETVEGTGTDHGLDFALVIYKVHAPDGDKRLLLETVGGYSELSNENVWWIRNHKFDYAPGSFEPVQPSGHGHSH